jgi:hypothetical protein
MKINSRNFMILCFAVLAVSLTAQYTTVDFEAGGVGADWAWTVTENGDNPPLEFVANPATGGINTSDTAAQFIARQAGQPWALCFTDDNGEFTFDASNSTFTIMVYKPVISNIGIKFEGPSDPVEIQLANTLTNQWEEMTFDFSGSIGNTYNRLVIIPDFVARTQDNTIYFDNIQLPEGTYNPTPEPDSPAPTPSYPAANVISLFSNAYTNVTVDTWSADWDQADVTDIQIQGNDTKKYTNLVFAGIEFTSQTIDATAMTNFYMDVWTPDPTALPAVFKIKLVDFGADGVFGGGDDVEHELTFDETTTPALASGTWMSFDLPLSDFTNLTTTEQLAQLIISADPNTVFIDNVLFHAGGTQSEPTVAAPTPTIPADAVISLFSNAYTNVTVDTWSADWDQADVEDIQIEGNDTKKYTNLVFAGIEFTSQTIDANTMTHFHLDIWTPDPTALPAILKVKLVDFGADGAWGGGDDVEHELTFDETTAPALASETWVGFDIPMADFTGLTTQGHLAQLIISGDPNTIYLDNVYFYDENTVADNGVSAPAFTLGRNYPNPFNPSTSIAYEITEPGHVQLNIYNIKGELIRTLVDAPQTAQSYTVTWDGTDNVGNPISSGVYFYQMQSGKNTSTRKMLLMK